MGRSEELYEQAVKVLPGGVNSPVRAYRAVGMAPRFITRADGAYIYNEDGKKYIDYVCSWGPMILGHNHPVIREAVERAVQDGLSFGAPTRREVDIAELMVELVPNIEMVRMVNSGTEAVMSALRLARGATGRDKLIKFEGCYHGHSDCMLVNAGSSALAGGHPSSAGVPVGAAKDTLTAQFNDLDSVKELLEGNPGQVAAVIVEPVAANMGVVGPAPGFLQGLRELCNQHGTLLIFDEVQTGMGRTGKMWACEHEGVAPDILVFGKALGAGIPMSGIVGRADLFEDIDVSFICSTYAGYSMGCRVANTVLDIIEEDHLLEKCTATGEYLKKKADELMAKHPIVGDYSAKGVYFGIELVRDRKTKEPAKAEAHELINNMRDAGLLAQLNGYYNNRISFIPPINLTTEQVDEIFDILEPEIAKVEAKYQIG